MHEEKLLLTGATGFVGSAAYPALARQSSVRCMTRDVARARARSPRLDWVEGDVAVAALVGALAIPVDASVSFDIPGPDVLSGEEILVETARAMGLPAPARVAVPLLSPRLSALWIRFVTRANWNVAREVVIGLE